MGHTITSPVIQSSIPAMHMPLFFILSGLTMRSLSTFSLKNIFANETKLFKIYYISSFIYIIFHYILNNSIEWTLLEFYQTVVFWGIEVLWFIATLILSKILLNIFSVLIKNELIQIILLSLSLIMTSYITPFINQWPNYNDENLIYCYYFVIALLRVPTAMFFLRIGKATQQILQKFLNFNYLLSFIVGCILLLILFIFAKYNGHVDMHFLLLGNYILLYILFALIGSYGVLFLSHGLNKIPIINTFFEFTGKNSLILMLIHFPIINIISKYFPRIISQHSNYFFFFIVYIICLIIAYTYSKLYFYRKKRG